MADFFAGLDPWLIYLAIGLLTFGESAAFLGLVLPGEVGLVAAAAIASAQGLDLVTLATVAAIGSAVGGMVGYEIFRRGTRLRNWRPIAARLGDIERWRADRSEVATAGLVAASRFNQVTRALIPAMAGLTRVSRPLFAVANLAGAALWATVFTATGYFAAEWWASTSGTVHFVVGAVIVAGIVAWALLRRSARLGHQRLYR